MGIEVLGAVSRPRKRFQTARAKCHWAAQLPVVSSAPGRPKSEELQTTAPSPTPTPLTPQTQTRPNRLHTHTHPPKRLAHQRSPIPPLSTLTSRATHAHPTSPRSTGFCAIWDCISSSSSSHADARQGAHRHDAGLWTCMPARLRPRPRQPFAHSYCAAKWQERDPR